MSVKFVNNLIIFEFLSNNMAAGSDKGSLKNCIILGVYILKFILINTQSLLLTLKFRLMGTLSFQNKKKHVFKWSIINIVFSNEYKPL